MRAQRGALGSGTAVRLARRAIAPPLPVARILAWRHARQLDNCHLESSANDCQRAALTPPWTPPARLLVTACRARSLHARGRNASRRVPQPKGTLAQVLYMQRCKRASGRVSGAAVSPRAEAMFWQSSQSVRWDAYRASVQSCPPAGGSTPLRRSRGRPGSVWAAYCSTAACRLSLRRKPGTRTKRATTQPFRADSR